jgi:hypothetical protein
MGLYAEVLGCQMKLSGLLAEAVLTLARQYPVDFQGVELAEYDGKILLGSVAKLTRHNVLGVVQYMRRAFLTDQINKYDVWGPGPLCYAQDIYQFHTDVEVFMRLATWYGEQHGDVLVFA